MQDIKKAELEMLRTQEAYFEAGLNMVRARRVWLEAGGTPVAPPPTASIPDHLDLSSGFRPDWKSGHRLTRFGAEAIFKAFDSRMRIEEAAALFEIAISSASSWRSRWKAARQADNFKFEGESP